MKYMFALILTMSFLNPSYSNDNSPQPLLSKEGELRFEPSPEELEGNWLYLGNVCLNEFKKLAEGGLDELNEEELVSLVVNPLDRLTTAIGLFTDEPVPTLNAFVHFDATGYFELLFAITNDNFACGPYMYGNYGKPNEDNVINVTFSGIGLEGGPENCGSQIATEFQKIDEEELLRASPGHISLLYALNAETGTLYLIDIDGEESCSDQMPQAMLFEKIEI